MLRVAIVGYGLGGRVFHAPLVATTDGMEVASIVTSHADRQARARAAYPEARVLDRPGDLWALSAEHDLVVITTPNRVHVPLALAAIDAGLPVVIDKPVAPTVEEAEAVLAAAEAAGLLLSVFQNRRWDGDFLTVRRLVAEGAVGRVVRYESRFERWRPEPKPGAWRELGDPEDAGGLLFDLGSHLIDQAMVLFGRPTHVYAERDVRRAGVEVDDDTFVALRHPGGERSHLWMSVLAGIEGPRLRVLGLEGAYEKFGLDGQEPALDAGALPGEGWGREPADRWGTLVTSAGEERVETEPGDYPAYYAGIGRALADGAAPPVDPRDAIDALRVIDAAARSARDGQVVELEWADG